MIDTSLLTLRPKLESDTDFLIALYETSREEEMQFIEWHNDDERKAFFLMQYNAQKMHFDTNYENLDYDIILYNNIDVGRLILHRTQGNLHCVDIIILPEYRKKGIGAAIMQRIEKELEEKNITSTLYFEKTKPYLEGIYGKYGFVSIEDIGTHKFMERKKSKE